MDNPSAMSGLCIALAVRFAATNVVKILDTDPITTDPVLFNQTLSELQITDGDPIRTFIVMLKSLVPDGAAPLVAKIPITPTMKIIDLRKLLFNALVAGTVPSPESSGG